MDLCLARGLERKKSQSSVAVMGKERRRQLFIAKCKCRTSAERWSSKDLRLCTQEQTEGKF